jgi:hypothetical protein
MGADEEQPPPLPADPAPTLPDELPPLPAEQPVASTSQPSTGEAAAAEAAPPVPNKPSAEEEALLKVSCMV